MPRSAGSGLLGAGAVANWAAAHAGDDALLLGEAPFVGNRLIELARREADAAECFLAARTTLFIVPAPTLAVGGRSKPRVSGKSLSPSCARGGQRAAQSAHALDAGTRAGRRGARSPGVRPKAAMTLRCTRRSTQVARASSCARARHR